MSTLRASLALAAALAVGGCATSGFQAVSPTMPAAKAGLIPEFRIFYDALEEYGDWTLIEPYGYVFRPRVSFVAWQPYQEGFWVPSDVWGWVWISSEPFGWATYHYGRWMFDDFQGWVWIPGLDWGPAWVDWRLADSYAGWAPLGPLGMNASGRYSYVPLSQLTSTNLKAQILTEETVQSKAEQVKPVDNIVVRGGVAFNRGPRFDVVERAAGPLSRVRISEIAPGGSKKGATAGAATISIEEQIEATQRAAEEAARQARIVTESGAPPPSRIPVVRPALTAGPVPKAPPSGGRASGRGKPAAADTTR
jgi:uncharacterized protein DUF6600